MEEKNRKQRLKLFSWRKNEKNSIIQNAARDTLTGLENREEFEQYYSKQAAYAQTKGKFFYLLRITLQNLERINKENGVQKADEALKFVGKTIKQLVPRANTHTARWGGGVFLVLGTHNAIAGELAQKIQDQVASAEFDPALQIDSQFYKIDSNKPLWELLQED